MPAEPHAVGYRLDVDADSNLVGSILDDANVVRLIRALVVFLGIAGST